MKKTFLCDESMVITIPIGSLKDVSVDQNFPVRFHCVYRDFYKVFVINGKPKPLGVSLIILLVFSPSKLISKKLQQGGFAFILLLRQLKP